MKQPISVFTNACYLWPAIHGVFSPEPTLQVFGVANFCLAAGSGAFHYVHQVEGISSSIETYWRYWDHRGMYLVLSTGLGHVAFLSGLDPTASLLGGIAIGVALSALAPRLNLYWMTGALVAANIVVVGVYISWTLAGLELLIFSAALAFRQLTDIAGRVESGAEDAGHGIWHLLTSIGLAIIPRF